VTGDIDCPVPSDYAPVLAGSPRTILDYAALASDAANRYQLAMDAREPYPACIRLASALARATAALATAIADGVAVGSNTLS
jgi:hypothetical protein